jgi:hypothetical protein
MFLRECAPWYAAFALLCEMVASPFWGIVDRCVESETQDRPAAVQPVTVVDVRPTVNVDVRPTINVDVRLTVNVGPQPRHRPKQSTAWAKPLRRHV